MERHREFTLIPAICCEVTAGGKESLDISLGGCVCFKFFGENMAEIGSP
jgi:hypothetical protein